MNPTGLFSELPTDVLEHRLRGAISAWPRSSFHSDVEIDCDCGYAEGQLLLAEPTQRLIGARCYQCGRYQWLHRVEDDAVVDAFMRDEVNCRLLSLWMTDAKLDSSYVADRAQELLSLVEAGIAPTKALVARRRRRTAADFRRL
jgi:hypothetical protein